MKVLFLGNHNVGIEAIKAIMAEADLVGVVAHPNSKEEKVVYDSVYEFTRQHKIDTIRGTPRDKEVQDFIATKQPDVLWVTDYKYILPPKILDIPKIISVNLHPSLLPKYRGRAVLNWAIINGEKKVGLTAHVINEGVDDGDILEQIDLEIADDEYIGSVLKRLYPYYFSLTREVLKKIKKGELKRTPQKITNTYIYPRRKPEDGKINWNLSSREIYNLIRAVSVPYPGAFCYLNDQKIVIWEAFLEPDRSPDSGLKNGQILACNNDSITVKCSDCLLRITKFEGQLPANPLNHVFS